MYGSSFFLHLIFVVFYAVLALVSVLLPPQMLATRALVCLQYIPCELHLSSRARYSEQTNKAHVC